jgi:hypothetical protein
VWAAAKIQLYRTRRAIETVEAKDAEWYAGALKRFHEMEETYVDISLQWHRFATKSVLQRSRDLLRLAKLLDEEAGLRKKMAK